MKPLAEIVAEIEATIKNKLDAYGDDANGVFIGHYLDEMARLCAAFRAGEKMREADIPWNYRSKELMEADDEWDRVTGGNDDT